MDRYGLIGFPLGHSFSKDFFNSKFLAEKMAAEYVNFEISSIDQLEEVIKANPALKGLSVTIPYKEQVIPYLDELSENAKQIGAVNAIRIERKKNKLKLIGYNSDIIGFKQSIEPLLEGRSRALVLGTGGSSKAVYYGLKQLGVKATLVSRSKSDKAIAYKDLDEALVQAHTVVVNCTPVGMFPKVDECPNIPYQYLTDKHLLYDLVYNPNETLFMRKGKQQGATAVNGLEMLLLQAYASWDFWTKPL